MNIDNGTAIVIVGIGMLLFIGYEFFHDRNETRKEHKELKKELRKNKKK